MATDEWRVSTAAAAGFEAVQQVFGSRGPAALCHCQRYQLAPGESFAGLGAEELAFRLRSEIVDDPGPGLVGILAGIPVAWCATQPRSQYRGLLRTFRVPWEGRDEDRADRSVWAVTCFVTRAGHRRRGYAGRLLGAAVRHARDHGARAVEGYPILTTQVITEELHVGTIGMFARAGFAEVSRPTVRRAVARIDF